MLFIWFAQRKGILAWIWNYICTEILNNIGMAYQIYIKRFNNKYEEINSVSLCNILAKIDFYCIKT